MTTTLESLNNELAALFASLAVIAEECYGAGAGLRMLDKEADESPAFFFDRVDVARTELGKMLPVWYAYAFEGVALAGYDIQSWDIVSGHLERLGDLIGLLRTDDGYVQDCLQGVGLPGRLEESTGHLKALHERVGARLALDKGWSLSIQQVALLADMNERSVRNALHAEGDNRLVLSGDDEVSSAEARRWLAGRRNFKPTQWRELRAELGEQPDTLLAEEIPLFISARLDRIEETWGDYGNKRIGLWNAKYLEASRICGLPFERILAATRLPFDVKPQESAALAELLRVDPVWFTHQVMLALFPNEMDMIMNPQNWTARPQPASRAMQSVVIELSDAMLMHGYLDIPIDAKGLFEGQQFGSKGSEFEGTQVELRFGSEVAVTDIRLKSAKTIAPRKRFQRWFNTELRAKPGDRIRIDKVSEGVYSLNYLPT